MANNGEDGNALRYGFLKRAPGSCQFFKIFKFGSKIVEILQNCSFSVDFLQEIAFNHLAKAN